MDDFVVTVTSNLAKSNCKKLEKIVLELMSRAKEAARSEEHTSELQSPC